MPKHANQSNLRSAAFVGLVGLLGLAPSSAIAQFAGPAARALVVEAAGDTTAGMPPQAPPTWSALRAAVEAGAGITQRLVRVPTGAGVQRLATDFVPALGVQFTADARLSRTLRLGLAVRYQTSVGAGAVAGGDSRMQRAALLRSDRFEGGVRAIWRVRADSPSVAVRTLIGWQIRDLRSVVELAVPSYSLQGPFVRLEVAVPLPAALRVRLAPEASVVGWSAHRLRAVSALAKVGMALGGEVALVWQAVEAFELSVAYRQSHAWVGSAWEGRLSDSERYLMLKAALAY